MEVEFRRLTILVGPNSAGKSLVMLLGWSLDNAVAAGLSLYFFGGFDANAILSRVYRGFRELVQSVLGGLSDDMLVELRVADAGVSLRIEKDTADLLVDEDRVKSIVGDARERILGYARVLRDALSRIASYLGLGEGEVEKAVKAVARVAEEPRLIAPLLLLHGAFGEQELGALLPRLIAAYVLGIEAFYSAPVAVYAPDGRAALSRLLVSAAGLSPLDAQYLNALLHSIRTGSHKRLVSDPVYRTVLAKLGVVGVKDAGNELSIAYWWGGETLLARAPSGVREALPLLLLMASSDIARLYVEEPEAHLHPPAVQAVAWAIARGVRAGKTLIVSTHSPTLFGQINDLIRVASLGREERRVYAEVLGVSPETLELMLLKPDDIVVNVFRVDEVERCTRVERREPKAHGYPEDVFEEIISVLASQRATLTALGEGIAGEGSTAT